MIDSSTELSSWLYSFKGSGGDAFSIFSTRCLTHVYFFPYAESFFSADLMLAFPPCFSADRVCAVTSALFLFLRNVLFFC